jgi:hypothetical protein
MPAVASVGLVTARVRGCEWVYKMKMYAAFF